MTSMATVIGLWVSVLSAVVASTWVLTSRLTRIAERLAGLERSEKTLQRQLEKLETSAEYRSERHHDLANKVQENTARVYMNASRIDALERVA